MTPAPTPLSEAELDDLRTLNIGDSYPQWAREASPSPVGIGDILCPRLVATIDALKAERDSALARVKEMEAALRPFAQ